MSRGLIMSAVTLWAGAALLLSRLRWFARRPLAERLRPYAPGGLGRPARRGLVSVESFAEVIEPLARAAGGRVAQLLGVGEDLELRLRRIHAPLDVSAFRVRQLGWSTAALGAGLLAALGTGAPLPVAALCVLGGPLLAFLVLEQQVAAASTRWQRRLFLELPVVAEQLAMLLAAGFSLSAAVNRVAVRGRGACARDLRRATARIGQGLSEAEALGEWAATAQVQAVDRLVAVLALGREASDLGRLLSAETRAVRRDVQRELIAAMERRAQQVWIPVTVAALIPGVIFLAIPFLEALRAFSP